MNHKCDENIKNTYNIPQNDESDYICPIYKNIL